MKITAREAHRIEKAVALHISEKLDNAKYGGSKKNVYFQEKPTRDQVSSAVNKESDSIWGNIEELIQLNSIRYSIRKSLDEFNHRDFDGTTISELLVKKAELESRVKILNTWLDKDAYNDDAEQVDQIVNRIREDSAYYIIPNMTPSKQKHLRGVIAELKREGLNINNQLNFINSSAKIDFDDANYAVLLELQII